MQRQKPSEGSPNKSPPSETRTLKPLPILKTPWQVWEELQSDIEDNEDNNDNKDGNDNSIGAVTQDEVAAVVEGESCGGGSVAAVVEGESGGGGSMAAIDVASEDRGKGKKRKSYDLKDPPSGKPICPVCSKEFSSWKGAFGHMRKHPDRDYRGFFKPPVSDSTSTPVNAGGSADKIIDDENSGEKVELTASASPSHRGLLLDLNQPIMQSPEPAEENNVDEGKFFKFDLNEMPAEDYDE